MQQTSNSSKVSQGKAEITVCEARLINKGDTSMPKVDAYIQLKYKNHQQFKTTIKNDIGRFQPLWGETFNFDVHNIGDELLIEIFDKQMTKNVFLGANNWTKWQTLCVANGGVKEDWFILKKQGNDIGQVKLRCVFTPGAGGSNKGQKDKQAKNTNGQQQKSDDIMLNDPAIMGISQNKEENKASKSPQKNKQSQKDTNNENGQGSIWSQFSFDQKGGANNNSATQKQNNTGKNAKNKSNSKQTKGSQDQNQAKQQNTTTLIDSQSTKHGAERNLVKFYDGASSSAAAQNSLLESLESSTNSKDRPFDQFNQKGVKSTYNWEMYSTQLKEDNLTQDQIKQAAKISVELEQKEKTMKTCEAEINENEEQQFSNVIRQDKKQQEQQPQKWQQQAPKQPFQQEFKPTQQVVQPPMPAPQPMASLSTQAQPLQTTSQPFQPTTSTQSFSKDKTLKDTLGATTFKPSTIKEFRPTNTNISMNATPFSQKKNFTCFNQSILQNQQTKLQLVPYHQTNKNSSQQ